MEQIIVGGQAVLLDESDLPLVHGWRWYIHNTKTNFYVRGYPVGKRQNGLFYMHRILMGAQEGQEIDHRNGNGLDNRRSNLRFCTRTQNNANRHAVASRSSPFKGVHFESYTGKWRAEITKNGVRYRLGRFDSVNDAERAYRCKSQEIFGDFSSANSK